MRVLVVLEFAFQTWGLIDTTDLLDTVNACTYTALEWCDRCEQRFHCEPPDGVITHTRGLTYVYVWELEARVTQEQLNILLVMHPPLRAVEATFCPERAGQ